MKRNALFLFVVLPLCMLHSHHALAQGPPGVEMFSPQGTVKKVRQVTARFEAPMVPFGDPRISDPFEVSCPVEGKGRWADDRNWAYDFEEDLPAGIRCDFALRHGLTALSGKAIGGQRKYSFSTGGPAILFSVPREGNISVDEEQIFLLLLDAEADGESVLASASFSVEGIREKIGAAFVMEAERKQLLDEVPARVFIALCREIYGKKTTLEFRKRKDLYDDPRIVILRAKQRFPAETKVNLVWGKGIRSRTGIATEEPQVLHFQSRGPFRAIFRCSRENPNAACIPLLPMHLRFSAPVALELAEKFALKGPGGKTYKPSPEREGEEADFVHSVEFKAPFPENSNFTLLLPKDLRDDAGRQLANADKFPLAVATDAFPPLAKFPAPFGIIELSDPVLPVTLRNLEAQVKTQMLEVDEKEKGENISAGLQGRLREIPTDREEKIVEWLRKVMRAQNSPWPPGRDSLLSGASGTKTFSIPKPGGEKAFEVVGIPLPKAGFFVVEMESRILGSALLGADLPMHVATAALVTNLSAHFKWGRESSIVWVTTLDKGEPVQDAVVTVRDSAGKILWRGATDESGIAWIRQELPPEKPLEKCSPFCGHFVTAGKRGDLTFVFSDWDEGIEPWRFQLPQGYRHDPTIAHTVFDRTLFRAGETVRMKHFIRRHSTRGLFPQEEKLPKAMLIRHGGSEQRYEFPLKWNPGGSAETTWKIPQDAKLGEYEIVLLRKETGKSAQRGEVGGYRAGDEEYFSPEGLASGSFRVEEYRVPLMKGSIQAPGGPFVRAKMMELDLLVSYLSGGGAGETPVTLRTDVHPRYVGFPDYGEFIFVNGKVREGVTRGARGNYDDEEGEEYETGEEAPSAPEGSKKRAMQVRELALDRYGALRAVVKGLPISTTPKDLVAELEYRDPNGETQTVSTRIPLWPSRLLVGIKPDSWVATKDAFKFHVAVLDLKGKPAADVSVTVDLFQRKNYSHRTRMVGGFYSYEHVTEVKRLGGTLCTGTTDAKGLLVCESTAPVSGNVILQATARDKNGNESAANRDVWVAGSDDWWFEAANSDRIDLLPERKRYEPGETARFQVRMPFREATALVTVEREGIVDAYLKNLSGKEPVIEIPVKHNHAPNVFVSALCVRGRIAGARPPTAMVDLAKPAYKLGIAEINVGWKAHELKVRVDPEKDVYRIREKVRARIRVGKANGGPPPKGTEAVVIAVDEGLLELKPNESWQLLRAMMGRRPIEVRTSTAQMQVIGKRHYGLKALPSGGGGGKQATRKLFDTLLYWNGRVPLDDNGEAEVEIPLNDSLTSFRIVAVASAGADLFGTGETSVRTTQDLILFSGLPPLVREADRFRAVFTVRNSSGHPMEVRVDANVSGGVELSPIVEPLASGEAREVGWDIRVPAGIDTLDWEVTAKAEAEGTGDRIKVMQKVAVAVPVRTFQATITQLAAPVAMEVEIPSDAVQGKGGIAVSFRAKLSEGMGGVKHFMKEYPYTCLEQKVSRAIALRDATLWKGIMEILPSYLDSDGLAKYFPSMTLGSDGLTAYLVSIAEEAEYEIPSAMKRRMEDALTGFIEGRIRRYGSLPTADLSIRKMAALEALSRVGKASPPLLGSITIEPNLWPTSAVLDWTNILLRMPSIPNREKRLTEAEQVLRSRLNFQGSTMGFSTERTDYLWWLMISGDVNAVKGVLTFLRMKGWEPDMPRVVNGAIGRQHHGAWNTTVANAWGVLAMEKFSRKYESVAVAGSTQAALSGSTRSVDWGKTPGGENVSLGWPKGKETLALSHKGTGKPWATIRSMAAIPLKEPFSSGYRIEKSLTPLVRKGKGSWGRGDVVRVTLAIDAQADMTWVVVSDPVPAGASILGTGLGRDSQLLTRGEKREGLAWPAFEERAFDSFRAYYEFVPKGRWTVQYTVRLNNEGTFLLPATRVEGLYAPEMLGEIPNPAFEVRP